MKLFFTAILLTAFLFGHTQTDSTEIKLQHYKEMYSKGIIDSSEYKALKEKLLGLNTNRAVAPAQPITVVVQPKEAQIDTFGLTTKQLKLKGQEDALENFKVGGTAAGTFCATFFGTPLIGLAPAIACSTSFNEANANYPNPALAKNPDYRMAYIKQCRNMKRTNAWGFWGGATALDIVGSIIIYSVIRSKQ